MVYFVLVNFRLILVFKFLVDFGILDRNRVYYGKGDLMY